MVLLISILALVVALLAALVLFLRSDPGKLAGGMRALGPVLAGLLGAGALAAGRVGFGAALLGTAFVWYGTMRSRRAAARSSRRHSMVRTAALEMELDQETGRLEGLVLAGRHEGYTLESMELAELGQLHRDIVSDPESRRLLEAYLDGRFPVWRKGAKADGGQGLRVSPGSGAMTKEEAYKILGLESGAAAAEIRKAHSRLMQRMHPEIGGTSFLAARIDEAKDILLSNHD